MSSTFFQDYNQNNPIVAAWLNDVNNGVYSAAGKAKTAVASASAWVRFTVVTGVVTIQQSYNVAGVVRSSSGVYVVSYSTALTTAANAYAPCMDEPGFIFRSAESAGSVTISTTNPANTAFDPNFVSVAVFGAN